MRTLLLLVALPLVALLLVACGDATPAAPAPAPPEPVKPTAKPAKAKVEPLLLAEELRDADALIFVATSKRTSLERGEGKYAERMVLSMSPTEVVFATPAITAGEALTVEVPYREIMERMGGTPNTRKSGLSKPNAHPTLPMGWALKRDGERWIVRAALRAMHTERDALKQLAANARGDPAPAAVLQRILDLSKTGAVGISNAIGQMFAESVAADPEARKPAALASLCEPHVDRALASLRPGAWPDVHVFILRHSDEATRKRAVRVLLGRYDAEVAARPPTKRGQAPADGVRIHGSTSLVLEDLLKPEAKRPLYPLDERDFKRSDFMKPEILASARAFAKPAKP